MTDPKKLGPYLLGDLLGRGGMGAVYRAFHEETDETVALKLLSDRFADEAHFRHRFSAEVESLIALDHPNIVRILSYDVVGDQMYYVMELVDGPSLFGELQRGRKFTWQEAAAIGIDICAALRHAHDRGIIHRDIKPGNLLLCPDGHVKLTDFGIAKLYGGRHLTADGGVLGTADYMAPEQAKGQPTSPRSDLYSLGSVMFALIARRPPFASKTLPEALHSLSFEAPPLIRQLAPATPIEFENILNRLLEKSPDNRIGSAQAVANRLRALQEDYSSEASPGDVPAAGNTAENATKRTEDQEFELAVSDPASKTHVPRTQFVNPGSATKPGGSPGHVPPNRDTHLAPTVDGSADLASSPHAFDTQRPIDGHVEVSDEDRGRRELTDSVDTEQAKTWLPLVAMLLILVAIAIIAVLVSQPASADDLFAKIATAQEEAADMSDLARIEDECREFIDQYPDDARSDTVRQLLTQIDAYRYPRQLLRRHKFNPDSLTMAEHSFLGALQLADRNPEAAIDKFKAIATLFANREGDRTCVDAARLQVEALAPIVEQRNAKLKQSIASQLAEAETVLNDDASRAMELLDAVIELYGETPAVGPLIERARIMRENALAKIHQER